MTEREIQLEYKEMVGIDALQEQWLLERKARGEEFMRNWLENRLQFVPLILKK